MAKRINLPLDGFQAQSFLKAVRTKRDVIVLWMSAIKALLVNQPPAAEQQQAQLSVVVQSMSRLFCTLGGNRKIFSIAFPFNIDLAGGEQRFYSREGILIDSRVSSQILALVEGGEILATLDFSNFIDPILEAVDIEPALWSLLRELMLAEDAYIRYDWDEDRADGNRHPLHHLDLYYSSSGSFKIGLPREIDQEAFIAILNVDLDCHYLQPAEAVRRHVGGRADRQ